MCVLFLAFYRKNKEFPRRCSDANLPAADGAIAAYERGSPIDLRAGKRGLVGVFAEPVGRRAAQRQTGSAETPNVNIPVPLLVSTHWALLSGEGGWGTLGPRSMKSKLYRAQMALACVVFPAAGGPISSTPNRAPPPQIKHTQITHTNQTQTNQSTSIRSAGKRLLTGLVPQSPCLQLSTS